jgi:hypothetical protein
MNFAKQKMVIEYLLSSKDLYARCASIIKPSFFDPELRKAVLFFQTYYQKYSALPDFNKIEVECDVKLTRREVKYDDVPYISEECEKFAKESAIKEAMQSSMKDMAEGNFDKVTQAILEAAKISLNRNLGIDLYDNPEKQLQECIDSLEFMPTGIRILDDKLGGGLVRKQLTLFSANSGVGKSVVMSNIGDNYAAQGYHVLYISLELPENMIYTRLAAIATGVAISGWKENIPIIAGKLNQIKQKGGGSYRMVRLPNGSNANDLRAYLKQYEMEFERKPDVILVDYLDLMSPIGGTNNLSVSEQDKAKSEQLYEIGVDYNAVMVSASQQNRDGIRMASPDQAVIAGGFSKINIVDNYISLYMTPKMRIEGIMLLYFLKTRSSSAVGENVPVKFNRENLQITDIEDEGKVRAALTRLQKEVQQSNNQYGKKVKPEADEPQRVSFSVIDGHIEGMPIGDFDTPPEESNSNDLLDLMAFANS